LITFIFISAIVPVLIASDSLIRKPQYLVTKLFVYLFIPMQSLAFTAGTYPDFLDNNFYNTAFRIDLFYQLISNYLLFLLIRYLKNRLENRLQKNKIQENRYKEFKFISKFKFLIMIVYGQEKNISESKNLINLAFHVFIIFILTSGFMVNVTRFLDWYRFIF
jgi:hypothetical protein